MHRLQADKYIKEKKGESVGNINKSIQKTQKWLFDNCDTNKKEIEKSYASDNKLKIIVIIIMEPLSKNYYNVPII